MIRFYLVLLVSFLYCSNDVIINVNEEVSGQLTEELYVIYNRNHIDTEFVDRSTDSIESFIYKREGFYDPNLFINIYHDLDEIKFKINQKELAKKEVWFDSEMEYGDWFELNFDKYYVIFEDEYLVKGSLDPEHEFEVYEVGIRTGGIE
ncbi:hypothetical protein LZF95_10265 [Algoriphagus sp. AGSA1]|uniref:hypothetical protein n=1 Tax=Algoriphagus sp. AGSA1 TaxID=2907213 RepID=UPI001F42EBDE|nr:hypothetical protein [Algoriphagus sp. AGSA1]MCE7055058.1 hypothetical protein [Algoriphagus sp. AGSA1]